MTYIELWERFLRSNLAFNILWIASQKALAMTMGKILSIKKNSVYGNGRCTCQSLKPIDNHKTWLDMGGINSADECERLCCYTTVSNLYPDTEWSWWAASSRNAPDTGNCNEHKVPAVELAKTLKGTIDPLDTTRLFWW